MNRCDFRSLIKILTHYISEGKTLSQIDLMYNLFSSFASDSIDFDFDNGQICRWIKGLAPVSPRIIAFYSDNNDSLSYDIEENILPLLYDTPMFASELYNLVISDMSISEEEKTELTASYSEDISSFVATVFLFSIERKFIKHDAKAITTGAFSPIVSDIIFDGSVPKACKHFCGRDAELLELHTLLQQNNKIFVNGIAGIGKSEFVKAYAHQYMKSYTNILYFTYSNSLQKMIEDMDFADDNPDDDSTTKFKKHNRFLRSLKNDTLIIIDNFNTTASKEPSLNIIIKYNCKVIFTTRSQFEIGKTFELREISDVDTLVNLVGKFYSETDRNRDVVIKIIEAVHCHTFSVELVARLLQKGLLEPYEVLNKLNTCSVNPNSTDKINATKDGENIKATFYSHLQTLFSLFLLDDEMQYIMRCLGFIPSIGIRSKLFANWLKLSDLNAVNELVEVGLVQNIEADKLSLHPLVTEITIADLKPSVENCKPMLQSIQEVCLRHGVDISYCKLLFSAVENIIDNAIKDNLETYIRFIEDAFSYMEKYKYERGMRLITSQMELYKSDLTVNDLALLYDCQSAVEAMFGTSLKKAIDLSKKALETCVESENTHLAANLNMNLGYYYHMNGDLNSAKLYMEKSMSLMSEHNELNNDIIIMLHNYSNLLSDCGEPLKAVNAMKKVARMIKESHTDMCSDYADLWFDIGLIYCQLKDNSSAESALSKAFNVYKSILSESEFQEKITLLKQFVGSTALASELLN